MNARVRLIIKLSAGLLSLSLLACQQRTNEEPQEAPLPPSDEVVLSPESPKRQYIQEALAEPIQRPLMDPVTGKITYDEFRTARVSSPISGRVIGAIAALGTSVRAGDTLAVLDSPDLGESQSAYAAAMADLNLANRNFQRVEELYNNGIAPRKERDQVEDSLTRTRSEAERARLKLTNLGARPGSVDNRFILRAPIGGIVTERNINPGMEVRPDLAALLFVISDLSQLWVQMDIFEKDIGLIHVGTKILLNVPAFPNENFTATVSYVSQVVDESSRTVKVRCTLPNADGRLLPAMYAAIEVQSDPGDLAIVVPLTSLFTENESDWIYVNIGDFHYQKRPVNVGLRLKDRAVILEGLKLGERFVTHGALLLRTEQDAEHQTGEPGP